MTNLSAVFSLDFVKRDNKLSLLNDETEADHVA